MAYGVVSTRETAQRLHISRETLTKYAQRDTCAAAWIRHQKLGERTLWVEEDIALYLEARGKHITFRDLRTTLAHMIGVVAADMTLADTESRNPHRAMLIRGAIYTIEQQRAGRVSS